MKRLILIALVAIAVLWISFSSYRLWFDNDQLVNPTNVFCEEDSAVLVINNYEETKSSNYFQLMKENALQPSLSLLDSLSIKGLKIYVSAKRPILIFDKGGSWKQEERELVQSVFKQKGVKFTHHNPYFMVSIDYVYCKGERELNFSDADKKASANYWEFLADSWRKTDMYNLRNGFYEYRSAAPNVRYGDAVKDIPLFSGVIPTAVQSYDFQERFYAAETDSVFRDGPMNEWVDQGFVTVSYKGHSVIVSDYRSQQTPRLILVEKSEEDSIMSQNDIYSFEGFQLTKDFPKKHKGRFYIVELEDKALLTESHSIAQELLVNHQLGKTLALSVERSEQFFGGLPSFVNRRFVSENQKSSKTWKKDLLFEVETLPVYAVAEVEENKSSWSAATNYEIENFVPIQDHLRNGVSVLVYSKSGKYTLFSPYGVELWRGDVQASIIGEVQVVDVFDNNKQQFLFRTHKQVHLIDLNGHEVGGFPYRSNSTFTTGISEFVWNGTKRFLVGNEKGEVVMLNNVGQELNIIQISKAEISQTPYALNIRGNLRAWAVDAENFEFLGYLENPAKAQRMGKIQVDGLVKHSGRVISYSEKEGTVYAQKSSLDGKVTESVLPVGEGKLFKVMPDYLVVASQNRWTVFDHEMNILQSVSLPFNEVADFTYLPKKSMSISLDYLQNKIHAYSAQGEELNEFPKEGRELIKVLQRNQGNQVYLYSKLAKSIICYKIQ